MTIYQILLDLPKSRKILFFTLAAKRNTFKNSFSIFLTQKPKNSLLYFSRKKKHFQKFIFNFFDSHSRLWKQLKRPKVDTKLSSLSFSLSLNHTKLHTHTHLGPCKQYVTRFCTVLTPCVTFYFLKSLICITYMLGNVQKISKKEPF